MEWLPPLVELLFEICVALAFVAAKPQPRVTPRVGRRPGIESDEWKCPSAAEFAAIVRAQEARRHEPATDRLVIAEKTHPLWDRELDY